MFSNNHFNEENINNIKICQEGVPVYRIGKRQYQMSDMAFVQLYITLHFSGTNLFLLALNCMKFSSNGPFISTSDKNDLLKYKSRESYNNYSLTTVFSHNVSRNVYELFFTQTTNLFFVKKFK